MMRISAVNSDQISAAKREVTTSTKTVHMKDILVLRKALKHVENQAMIFNLDLINPTFQRRPDVNSFERVLNDLDLVGVRANQLVDQIKTSSYLHNASKLANLETIKSKIDTLKKNVTTNFNRSQSLCKRGAQEKI